MSSESAKIRHLVLKYMEGKTVLDLGCGDEKIVPWAEGVDDASEWKVVPAAVDIQAKIDPDSKGLDFLHSRPQGGYYDAVISSHSIEHLRSPILETLRYWCNFVKPGGGHLILYNVDERRYVYAPKDPKARNPAHKHYLTFETFEWYLQQLQGMEVILRDEKPVDYSFLHVLRRA